jgi:hypothetical protein
MEFCSQSHLALQPLSTLVVGFWIKESNYREQPVIRFKEQLIVVLEGPSQYLAWSTIPAFNSLFQSNLRPPVMKVTFSKKTKYFMITCPLQYWSRTWRRL